MAWFVLMFRVRHRWGGRACSAYGSALGPQLSELLQLGNGRCWCAGGRKKLLPRNVTMLKAPWPETILWPWQITRRPDKQKARVSNILETGWMTATAIRFLLIPYLIMIKWKYFISYRKKETEAGQGESWTFQGNPLPVFGLDCIMYFIEIII